MEGIGDNAGAFLGPLLAVALLFALGLDIRWIFYLAIIPGLLAVLMILLVRPRVFFRRRFEPIWRGKMTWIWPHELR